MLYRLDGRRWQHLDLPNQEALLVDELVVVRPFCKELRQEFQELLPIVDQNLLNGYRLVRVGDEDLSGQSVARRHRSKQGYLKHMEALILHHLAVVLEQVHADFQVIARINICHHDVVVGPIQQDLAKQFD